MRYLAGLLLFALLFLSPAFADVVLGATGGGFYSSSSLYKLNGTDNNYIAGIDAAGDDADFRNWFTFDLSGVTGTVTGATLTLHSPHGETGAGDYFVHAPTTAPAVLGTPGSAPDFLSIFNDLGSGPALGSYSYSCSVTGGDLACDHDEYVVITLDSTAIADINAALGGAFALSGNAVPSQYNGVGHSFVFGFTDHTVGEGNTLTLQTVPTPEPATLVLLGAGLASFAGVFSRKRN